MNFLYKLDYGFVITCLGKCKNNVFKHRVCLTSGTGISSTNAMSKKKKVVTPQVAQHDKNENIASSVWLGLFIRNNEMCNTSDAPLHRLEQNSTFKHVKTCYENLRKMFHTRYEKIMQRIWKKHIARSTSIEMKWRENETC